MHDKIRTGLKYISIGLFGIYAIKTFKDIIVNGGKLEVIDENGDKVEEAEPALEEDTQVVSER